MVCKSRKSCAIPLSEAVEQGKIKFIPDNWSKTYFEWMHNIQDWCISRQLWWGHRIPAWYDDNGNIYVEIMKMILGTKHHLPDSVSLRQDNRCLRYVVFICTLALFYLRLAEDNERSKLFTLPMF